MLDFLTLNAASQSPSVVSILYSIMLSFVLSTVIAFIYEKTFQGISYSRNYLQAIILGSIVIAVVMQAIGDNLARGLGMLGALAIVRFRTNLKDTRDMIFLFASFAVGIACGVHSYSIAAVGTAGFCIAAVILARTPLGQRSYFDALLRFNLENKPEYNKQFEKILQHYCSLFVMVTLREISRNQFSFAYHVKFKKSGEQAEMISKLNEIATINGVQLLLQETTVEI